MVLVSLKHLKGSMKMSELVLTVRSDLGSNFEPGSDSRSESNFAF
jgi:hypothetical protein